MHNQHAGLSQSLADQRIRQRHKQAAQARLAQSAGRSYVAAEPAVRHPHRVG